MFGLSTALHPCPGSRAVKESVEGQAVRRRYE